MKVILSVLSCFTLIATIIFPHEARFLAAAIVAIIGVSVWLLIVLGLLMMFDVIKIPLRNHVPRMSWRQALKETVDDTLNGTLLSRLR